jgi:hypothetical protein
VNDRDTLRPFLAGLVSRDERLTACAETATMYCSARKKMCRENGTSVPADI